MTASAAGATVEAAAIETAIAFDTVTTAEGRPTDRCALRIGSARAAEGDVSTAETATDRATDALTTIEPATTLGSSRAATALEAAAVQRTVAGDPVVIAEDGSTRLAAFARVGALPAKPNGSAIAARGATDAIRAAQTTATDGIPITPAAVVVAAVQDAVGVDAVRGADRGPR